MRRNRDRREPLGLGWCKATATRSGPISRSTELSAAVEELMQSP
jgi:hypothetical protein